MGFLDELKAQADEQQRKDEEITQWRLQVLSQNFIAVQAKLGELNRGFTLVADALNKLKTSATRSLLLDGVKIENLAQIEYSVRQKKFTQDNRDFLKEIHLRFKCVGEGEVAFKKEGESNVNHFRTILQGSGLNFDCDEQVSERRYVERATFKVRKDIPVVFAADGDVEKGTLRIRCKNLERVGVVNEFLYKPEEVSEELLDELAKFILGQPSRFREIGEHQQRVLAAFRAAKEKADAAKAQAAAEPEEEPAAPEVDAEEKPKLLSKLRSIFR